MLRRQFPGMLPAAQHCLLNHILSGLEIAVNDRQDDSHEGAWNAASHPCRAVVTARSCHAATTRRRPTAFSQTLKIPAPSPGPLKRTAPAWRRGPQVRQPLQRRPRQPRLPKPRRAPGRVHPDPDCRARARAESARRSLRARNRPRKQGPSGNTTHILPADSALQQSADRRSAPAPYLPVLRVTGSRSAGRNVRRASSCPPVWVGATRPGGRSRQ